MIERNLRKIALITGASSGIGLAAARTLHEAGYFIAALSRSAGRLDELVASLGGQDAGVALPCDVTDQHAVANAVGRLVLHHDRIDVLVNNAGLMRTGAFAEMHAEDIADQVQANLLGAIWVLRSVLPIMRQQQSGTVINVASVLGRVTRDGAAVYCATKWGVVGLTDALRKEFVADGIRFVCLEPGLTQTPLHQDFDQVRQATGVERALAAEDVAAAIRYAAEAPPHVQISELLIRPTGQRV